MQPIPLPPILYILAVLGLVLYYIFPAYVANAIPVLAGGGLPIDLGKNFIDGQRILGDGKTYRGFAAGTFMAWVTSMVQQWINPWFLDTILHNILLSPEEYILLQT
ncbi:MAG: CDP-archaeol synthase, partial [Candidatus Ranarchaeia archaeon]